jgi:hypothetical protein
MYFQIKNILKKNHNYTPKYFLKKIIFLHFNNKKSTNFSMLKNFLYKTHLSFYSMIVSIFVNFYRVKLFYYL